MCWGWACRQLKIHVNVGRSGLAPVGTGASSEEGAACTKEVPAREGRGEARLARRAANHS